MMVPERERKTSGCGVRNSPGFKVRLPAGFHLLLGSSSLLRRTWTLPVPIILSLFEFSSYLNPRCITFFVRPL